MRSHAERGNEVEREREEFFLTAYQIRYIKTNIFQKGLKNRAIRAFSGQKSAIRKKGSVAITRFSGSKTATQQSKTACIDI
jgi:hypothetical protein